MPPQIPIGTIAYDGLESFDNGVDQGKDPLKIPRNTMSRALNVTVRGEFANPRPPFQIRDFTDSAGILASAFSQGTFQGAAYYKPDVGDESLFASIAGRLFQFQISGNSVTLSEQTGGNLQLASAPQAWMWQSEKWLIWNDGVSNPVFGNFSDAPSSTTRSNYGVQVQQTPTTVLTPFTTPGVGGTVTGAHVFQVVNAGNMIVGDVIVVTSATSAYTPIQFQVITVNYSGNTLIVSQINGVLGTNILNGDAVTWTRGSSGYNSGATYNYPPPSPDLTVYNPGVGMSFVIYTAAAQSIPIGSVVTIGGIGTYSVTDNTGVQSFDIGGGIMVLRNYIVATQLTGAAGTQIPQGTNFTWPNGTGESFNTTMAANFTTLGIGQVNNPLPIVFQSLKNLVVGDIVNIGGYGYFLVTMLNTDTNETNLTQITGVQGSAVPSGSVVTWTHTGTQLQPGRMGAYGMGRNVYSIANATPFTPTQTFNSTLITQFTIPPVGNYSTIVDVTSVANLSVNDVLTLDGSETFQVIQIFTDENAIVLKNLTGIAANVVTSGTGITWQHPSVPSQPGGRQFVYGDIVSGSSGTAAQKFRDAVLYQNENNFIVGGGAFTAPGNDGPIMAMKFTANLDQSLGQGPLQIFTRNTAFSCAVPTDRTVWQSTTNPILTESLIGNGATGQDSTQLVNSDTLFRSPIGEGSLILSRRDFNTWGNVPISFEIGDILDADDQSLLIYGSATEFDNRFLFTVTPSTIPQGVVHGGLIALDEDPVSSLRGKEPSVYDGLWQGASTFKIITGEFRGVSRCFAFVWNSTNKRLELWELLPSSDPQTDDNGNVPVTWSFTSGSLDFGFQDPKARPYLRLTNGEFYIDNQTEDITFSVYWKPDQYPAWVLWQQFTTKADLNGAVKFQPRLGLGQPSPIPCDPSTGRPLREGFTFQLMFVITGSCNFLGARFQAQVIAQPEFAKIPACATPVQSSSPTIVQNPLLDGQSIPILDGRAHVIFTTD